MALLSSVPSRNRYEPVASWATQTLADQSGATLADQFCAKQFPMELFLRQDRTQTIGMWGRVLGCRIETTLYTPA